MSNPRKRLNPQELEALYEMRRIQKELRSKKVPFKVIPANSDEADVLKQYTSIMEKSNEYGINPKNVRSGWLKFDKTASLNFKNPGYVDPDGEPDIENIDFTSIFSKHLEPVKVELNPRTDLKGIFDRAVFTDAHINMDPNPSGYSLYGGRWNVDDIDAQLTQFVNTILESQTSRTLYIDDLGDFMDGFARQTTRGGHELPQLMPDQDAYDIGKSFKIRMIDALIPYYDKIICHNVCNDNHAGAFGYFVNSAFKDYIELKYPERVEVVNHRKFMDHYIIETESKYKYGFILCHGKDDKDKKFGINPKLTDKDKSAIEHYINSNYLNQKDLILEFSKGDSHQRLFDDCSSTLFNFYNYYAFSPSSQWVQINFTNGKSGFDVFNYRKDLKKPRNTPYEFEWRW
jgi:hypothetical protein